MEVEQNELGITPEFVDTVLSNSLLKIKHERKDAVSHVKLRLYSKHPWGAVVTNHLALPAAAEKQRQKLSKGCTHPSRSQAAKNNKRYHTIENTTVHPPTHTTLQWRARKTTGGGEKTSRTRLQCRRVSWVVAREEAVTPCTTTHGGACNGVRCSVRGDGGGARASASAECCRWDGMGFRGGACSKVSFSSPVDSR